MRSLVLILLLLCSDVYATADGPDYWMVDGVAADDVLNIRLQADFRSDKIGEIPANANCLKNITCTGGLTLVEFTSLNKTQRERLLKQRPRWCRIEYQGMNGWVSAKYLREGSCAASQSGKYTAFAAGEQHYLVEGKEVSLSQGIHKRPIPGTSSAIITEVVSTPVYGDFDNDGIDEVAVVLIQHTGSRDGFYYLAVAKQKSFKQASLSVAAANTSLLIEAVYIGDRIKLEEIQLNGDAIVVSYLDHSPQQAMAKKPAIKTLKRFKLDQSILSESH